MRLDGSIALALFLTAASVATAQQLDTKKPVPGQPVSKPQSVVIKHRTKRCPIPVAQRTVIPPATVLNNPEYISGEASITVASNSNPLIRIGMAQNGVTLIEFPSADKFFAVHAGNSDLVTVEKSPSLRRDHHLVLRAGSGFLVPARPGKGANASLPSTSIIAQMDSGMAITLMIYPVPLLKQQAHRLVINYKRDEVISARKTAGLATNLAEPEPDSQPKITTASFPEVSREPNEVTTQQSANAQQQPSSDFKEQTESALKDAVAIPTLFKNWTEARHGLKISVTPPRELSDTVRVVVFGVRNITNEPLRVISGYPDVYIETLNNDRNPVEAGLRVHKIYVAANGTSNLIPPGETRVFALTYEAPILGAQQHLKLVVAHMTAADEPAVADITAIAR